RCQEGPFVNRQSVQAEEPGDRLGEGEGESREWWHRSADTRGVRGAAGSAAGPAASGAEGGHLSAATGSATPNRQAGQTRGVSNARHTQDLRPGVSAGAAESAAAHLRAGIR